MKKPKYPNGLRAAMETAGKGPTELAAALDTNKQNITRWSNGERKLTVDWAKRLAGLLNTTPDVLLLVSGSDLDNAPKSRKRLLNVPLLDTVTAGKLKTPSSQIPVEDVPLLAFADLGRGEWFALRVEDRGDGDSMDRLSPPGSVIVVNKADRELRSGRCYIFSIGGETTYKMWQDGDPPYLAPYSTNPVHKPIFVKRRRDFEVIGRVKRTVLDL